MAFNNFFRTARKKNCSWLRWKNKNRCQVSELLVMVTSHFCCLPGEFIFAFDVMHTCNPSLNGFQCTWTLLKDHFIAHKNSILHVMNKVDPRNIGRHRSSLQCSLLQIMPYQPPQFDPDFISLSKYANTDTH